jgi:Restriction endonuclease
VTAFVLEIPTLADDLLALPESVVNLDEVIIQRLMDQGLGDLEVLDVVDELKPRLVREIDLRFAYFEATKLETPYEWVDMSKDALVRQGLVASVQATNPVRERTAALAGLQKLTGTQFEYFCAALLVEYGVDRSLVLVTPSGNEGGVDFIAVLDPPARGPLNRVHRTPFRLVGQAKRYKGEVDHDKVQAFCGRVDACRKGFGKALEKLPEWFVDRKDPILGLLMTTGTTGPSAQRVAREHVVLLFEGQQLADDLRRSSIYAACLNGQGQFDEDLFLEFVAGLSHD